MQMINDRISLSVQQHVAHVELSRGDKMNALDAKMLDTLLMVAQQIAADKSIRAVVISGQGGNFCAGLDKSNFANALKPQADSSDMEDLCERTHGIANRFQGVVWQWRELSMPVIAAIEGMTLGGGLQIALAADMRYASADSQFSILEIKWGLVPDMSSTQLMRHLASEDIVRELTYTGRIFPAAEAKEYGFITQLCEDPLAHAMEMAQRIVTKNPQAIQANKRLFNQAPYLSAADGLMMESVEQEELIGSENQIEAIMAVLEKRSPVFKD